MSMQVKPSDADAFEAGFAEIWPGRSDADFVLHALDSAAIVAVTDVQGTIISVNRKFCEISGYCAGELLGANHRILNSGTHGTEFFRKLYRTIANGEVWAGEICNRAKDGSLYWVATTIVPRRAPTGKVDGYIAIRFDITGRKQAEDRLRRSRERLQKAVNVDTLTGLANRTRFNQFLKAELARPRVDGTRVWLGLIDLDGFQFINDSFGHGGGDVLLREVARRLRDAAGPGCFISRLGGDEFAMVIAGQDAGAARAAFEFVLASLRAPVQIGAHTHRCSASVGVASFPGDADSIEDLIRAADMALCEAKSLGRDRMRVYDVRMRESLAHRIELHRAVEFGLGHEQFAIHYQPIVPVDCEAGLSFEALLRWNHPELGMISPFRFYDTLRDPGIAWAIGDYVMHRVVSDMRWLIDQGVCFDRVAINVTDADFRDGGFPQRLLRALAQHDVPTGAIGIEVTEGMFLGAGTEHVALGLDLLHKSGVEIALDDFGTGFASLTHLRFITFDRLKIDRSFIASLENSPEDAAIVNGIIGIAHALGKRVTAEGVETEGQAQMLRDMGCDRIQGWLFAKAQPLDRLAQLAESLRRGRTGSSGRVTSLRARS